MDTVQWWSTTGENRPGNRPEREAGQDGVLPVRMIREGLSEEVAFGPGRRDGEGEGEGEEEPRTGPVVSVSQGWLKAKRGRSAGRGGPCEGAVAGAAGREGVWVSPRCGGEPSGEDVLSDLHPASKCKGFGL